MMTRRDLLKRLQDLEAQDNSNMELPIMITVGTQVPDKRKRDGFRTDHVNAFLMYALSGEVRIGDDSYMQLIAITEPRS